MMGTTKPIGISWSLSFVPASIFKILGSSFITSSNLFHKKLDAIPLDQYTLSFLENDFQNRPRSIGSGNKGR